MDGQPVDGAAADLWVSISECARIKGRSKQGISKRVKRLVDAGLLETKPDGSEIKFNIVAYDRAIGETTDPAQALRNPDIVVDGVEPTTSTAPTAPTGDDAPVPKSKGYMLHKETSAAYQAENDRLDLEERLGKLCGKADVEMRTFNVFRRLRDRMLSLPAICAPLVATVSDERAVRTILDDEFRKMLLKLAKDLDQADADGESAEPGDEDEVTEGAAQLQ